MLPIVLVERQPFREWLNHIDPSFTMPTRYKIKTSCLPELREKVTEAIKLKLKDIEWINICIDGWDDYTMRVFDGYIAQGINSNWELKSIVLDFKHVRGT